MTEFKVGDKVRVKIEADYGYGTTKMGRDANELKGRSGYITGISELPNCFTTKFPDGDSVDIYNEFLELEESTPKIHGYNPDEIIIDEASSFQNNIGKWFLYNDTFPLHSTKHPSTLKQRLAHLRDLKK